MELGEIEVKSRVGEPFSARIPFSLDDGTSLSNLSVELADLSEYKTLSVHYHSDLRFIRADIRKNFFNHWIELSSRSPINSPVFSIVLKVSYGRATHFKKYPLFLDVLNTSRPKGPTTLKSENAIGEKPKRGGNSSTEMAQISLDASLIPDEKADEEKVPATTKGRFKPFDGWARISQYGPIVYGDTLFTIADRLRIDERYSMRQVMVALYEKNRSKFSEGNLHLPIAGTYLDTPLAEEVEKRSSEEALSIIQKHDARWKELQKQSHYAAIAKAQKNRYRIRTAGASSN